MPSPFPGMNPYLEQEDAWHDFHERFMPLAAERIAAQVDPRYIVKIDEHVYIHELSAEQRRFWAGRTSPWSRRARRRTIGRGKQCSSRRRKATCRPWMSSVSRLWKSAIAAIANWSP